MSMCVYIYIATSIHCLFLICSTGDGGPLRQGAEACVYVYVYICVCVRACVCVVYIYQDANKVAPILAQATVVPSGKAPKRVYTYIYIYLFVYICVCVCACVYVYRRPFILAQATVVPSGKAPKRKG